MYGSGFLGPGALASLGAAGNTPESLQDHQKGGASSVGVKMGQGTKERGPHPCQQAPRVEQGRGATAARSRETIYLAALRGTSRACPLAPP